MNGEFISKITDILLQSGKYSADDLVNNPEILNNVIRNNFSGSQNRDKLIQFLRSFDSGYVEDWVKYMTSDLIPDNVKQRYAERIVTMMTKMPVAVGAATIGADAVFSNNNINSYMLGGILNYINLFK